VAFVRRGCVGVGEAVAAGIAEGSGAAGVDADDIGPDSAGEDAGAGRLTELVGPIAGPTGGTSTFGGTRPVGGIAGRGCCSDGGRTGGACPGSHTPEARLNPTAPAHPTNATASDAHRVRSTFSSATTGIPVRCLPIQRPSPWLAR
jgi:hypothetical protein